MLQRLKGKKCGLWIALCVTYVLMWQLGRLLDGEGKTKINAISILLSVIVSVLIGCILPFMIGKFQDVRLRKTITSIRFQTWQKLVLFFVFFLIYFIVLLGVYPGFFVYDAGDELQQVITREFSAHHPLFHVLYMGGLIQGGYKIFGTYNAGIFLFMLIQTAIFSFGNVYMLQIIGKKGGSNLTLWITGIFLALFPVIQMMVLCSTKDSIFSFCVMIWAATYVDVEEKTSLKKSIWRIFWGACVCLLRNNAIYAMMVWGLFTLVSKKYRKYFLEVCIIVVVTWIASFSVKEVLGAKEGGKQEMLTVPIQQIARVYNLEPEAYNEEDREILNQYIPEQYWRYYRPKLSDPVKWLFDNELYKQDKQSFWRLWVKGFVNCPVGYAKAWLLTSYGYWYPWAKIDVYEGNQVSTFVYGDNCYFGYETELPGHRETKIPWIDTYFWKLSLTDAKEKIPFVRLLFAPGFILWVYLFGFAYMICEKRIMQNFQYVLFLLIIATLLLGPTYLPRYVFFTWYCLPLFITDMIGRQKA